MNVAASIATGLWIGIHLWVLFQCVDPDSRYLNMKRALRVNPDMMTGVRELQASYLKVASTLVAIGWASILIWGISCIFDPVNIPVGILFFCSSTILCIPEHAANRSSKISIRSIEIVLTIAQLLLIIVLFLFYGKIVQLLRGY